MVEALLAPATVWLSAVFFFCRGAGHLNKKVKEQSVDDAALARGFRTHVFQFNVYTAICGSRVRSRGRGWSPVQLCRHFMSYAALAAVRFGQ